RCLSRPPPGKGNRKFLQAPRDRERNTVRESSLKPEVLLSTTTLVPTASWGVGYWEISETVLERGAGYRLPVVVFCSFPVIIMVSKVINRSLLSLHGFLPC